MKTCQAPDCTYPVFSKGYCKRHQHLRTDEKAQKRTALLNKPIRKESDKMHTARLQYAKLRKAFLKAHSVCEIPVSGCTHQATDVHHMAGRGKQLLNTDTWKAACRSCHTWVTEHSREAIEMGYSQSRLKRTA